MKAEELFKQDRRAFRQVMGSGGGIEQVKPVIINDREITEDIEEILARCDEGLSMTRGMRCQIKRMEDPVLLEYADHLEVTRRSTRDAKTAAIRHICQAYFKENGLHVSGGLYFV